MTPPSCAFCILLEHGTLARARPAIDSLGTYIRNSRAISREESYIVCASPQFGPEQPPPGVRLIDQRTLPSWFEHPPIAGVEIARLYACALQFANAQVVAIASPGCALLRPEALDLAITKTATEDRKNGVTTKTITFSHDRKATPLPTAVLFSHTAGFVLSLVRGATMLRNVRATSGLFGTSYRYHGEITEEREADTPWLLGNMAVNVQNELARQGARLESSHWM